MPKARILVFGNSHVDALIGAYSPELSDEFGLELYFYRLMQKEHFFYVGDTRQYNAAQDEQELRALIRYVRPTAAVSMVGGQQAILLGMTGPERPFEFYFPGEEQPFDPAHEIVPYDMLLATCKEEFRDISRLLDDLRSVMTMPALALCPPPPIADAEFILARFPQDAAESMRRLGVPPAAWRVRIWRLCILALQAVYLEHGIGCLLPPCQSHDAKGFLLPSFWSDGVHGNVMYGRLLIEQIVGNVTTPHPL